MAPSQTPIWSSQAAYFSWTLLANASMFGREQYFPKAITSAPHFGKEMAAPLQSSHQPPAQHLLQIFGIHQCIHHYVPRFDYISGPSNHVADALSRDFHLSWPDLILSLHRFLPQPDGCQLWTPSKKIVSAVISALLNKPSCRESLQGELPAPLQHGTSGLSSQLTWASTPFSKPSTTNYHSYKSLPHEFIWENLQPVAIPSGLDRLKITYGWLDRRSSMWGPTIPA